MKKLIFIIGAIAISFAIFINVDSEMNIVNDPNGINSIRINGINYTESEKVIEIISILKNYDVEMIKDPFPIQTDDVNLTTQIRYLDGASFQDFVYVVAV